MKDEFITQVLAIMMGIISQEQCGELKTALYMALQEYEIEKRCTELLDLDTSYIHYMQLFLARKKTEGKSERTINLYKLHLTRMLQSLNMAVDKITENDLFVYLARYKKDNNVSNAYLDNIRLVFYGKNVVVYGKGSKERETYLNAASCLHLKAYLEGRTDDNEALFVSERTPHTRITVAGVEKILRRIGKDAGVTKVHPHRFRRTMATNVLKKGMPLEEVRELLGHTKLDTTMIYCTISKENVKHSHQRLMSA